MIISICCVGPHIQQTRHQTCTTTNNVCCQLNRENCFSLSSFVPESKVPRNRFGRLVPRQGVARSSRPG